MNFNIYFRFHSVICTNTVNVECSHAGTPIEIVVRWHLINHFICICVFSTSCSMVLEPHQLSANVYCFGLCVSVCGHLSPSVVCVCVCLCVCVS